jgi:hypothetical protein
VLAATGHCPWYLEQLVNALAELGVLALGNLPEAAVDRFLAEVREYILQQH